MDHGDYATGSIDSVSVKDREALGFIENSVTYENKRYQWSLPWRNSRPELPNNRFLAENRLNQDY